MSLFCSSGDLEGIIKSLIYSTNGLSILGSIMVLMTYILLTKLRKTSSRRYLAYLNISNLLYGITALLVYQDIFKNESIPQSQYFSDSYFVLYSLRYCSFLWPLILAINFYQIVATNKNNTSRYEFIWLLVGFVVPFITVFILNYFGLIQFHQSLTVTIIQYITPVVFILFFILLAYVKSINASKFAFEDEEEVKKFIKMILPYPIITIALYKKF